MRSFCLACISLPAHTTSKQPKIFSMISEEKMALTSTDLVALARDFESPNWNSSKALAVLYANRGDRSAVQSICHAMENLTDKDLLSSLMQLCHLIVIFDFPELEQLLMERCQNSMHFALRMFFLLQAAMEDEIPEFVFKTNRMWKRTTIILM